MEIKTKLVIFEKKIEGQAVIGSLGAIYSDDLYRIAQFDPRKDQLSWQVFEYDQGHPTFEGRLELTIDNGWDVLYEGQSFNGNARLN